MTIGNIQRLEPEVEACYTSANSSNGRFIQFGEFQVDLQKEVVTKDGLRLKLGGKAYRVLLALLKRPGQIVAREALCQSLWPSNTSVKIHYNLNTIVNMLRRALGDSCRKSTYIKTIPGRGYTLVAHPEVSDHPRKLFALNTMDATDSHRNPLVEANIPATPDSHFWSIRRVIAFILVGMLLGAGTMAVWISSHGQGTSSHRALLPH